MHPDFGVDLPGWHAQVSAYGLFLSLAAACAILLGWLAAVRRGVPAGKAGLCVLGMAAPAALGARLLDGATRGNLYSRDPSALYQVDFSGFSLFGALLLALPAGFILCRFVSVDPVAMADALAPPAGLGIAISKAGCFLAGCCFGDPTALPWGVTFPTGSEAHLHQLFTGAIAPGRAPLPVHPIQLFESVAAMAGAAGALWLLGRHVPRGSVFLGFAVWFTAFRLVEEPLRATSLSLSVPPWFYPSLYTVILLAALVLLVFRLRPASPDRPAPPGASASSPAPGK